MNLLILIPLILLAGLLSVFLLNGLPEELSYIFLFASLLLGLAFATWPPMLGYRRGVHSLRRAIGLAVLNITGMALAWAAALWLGGWFGQAAFAWAQSAGWGVFQAGLASLAGSLLVGFGAAQVALRAFRAVSGA